MALRWFGALWLSGWLLLPASRRLFPRLPDAGLSAGRLLFLLIGTLICFWGAALHLLPLRLAPIVLAVLAFAAAWGWREAGMRAWARDNRKNLVFSDAMFTLAWAFFLWVRLCHPEVGDLEKPMDMALISAGMRADWLPFPNPWYSDALFTNYYYFGHLMGALLARSLFTAPHIAYNLIQPTFCAFFLSVLCSVGWALSRSKWGGVGVMLLVGVGGHYEPLRQIAQKLSEKQPLWPLDWWKTSRVIENTINEYPAFTLGIGDAHAHFFALSFAVLWFALLLQLFGASLRRRRITLVICGVMLGAWLMTNTWDVPLFGLLLLIVAGALTRPIAAPALSDAKENSDASPSVRLEPAWMSVGWAFIPFVLAVIVSRPYFATFKSQVSGAVFDPWRPDIFSMCLLWGSWWTLGALAWLLPSDDAASPESRLRRTMIGVGLLALIAPFIFYIKGYFGDGDLRHQDTVFKFGLQAWLLLGTGIASELFARWPKAWATPKIRYFLAPTGVVLAGILALAPVCVFRTRTQDGGPWSLNGMKFLPQADQNAISWLQGAPAQSVVLEGVRIEKNAPVGDYDGNCGRISTFSGLPTPLGWPGHVWMWGADYGQVQDRGRIIDKIYQSRDFAEAKRLFGVRYVVFGANEGPIPPEVEAGLKVQKFEGTDGSQASIGVVD